jgi:hypothetical protein
MSSKWTATAAAGAGATDGEPPIAKRAKSDRGIDATATSATRNTLLRDAKEVRSLVLKYREAALVENADSKFKYVTFHIRPDSTGVRNPSVECIQELQKHLLFDKEIVDADYGHYTWLLKDIHGYPSFKSFIFAPFYSGQEVGTLHKNLDDFTQEGKVLIAGELQITINRIGEKRYIYNTLSGTYTVPLLKRLTAKNLEKRYRSLKDFLITREVSPELIEQHTDEPLFTTIVKEKVLPSDMVKLYSDFCEMTMIDFAEKPKPPKTPKKPRRGGARRKTFRKRRHTKNNNRTARSTKTHRRVSRV